MKVIRDEVVTVRVKVSVGPVDERVLGTFGWFIRVRNRHPDNEIVRDRTRYGTCVICRRKFADDDPIHMVFNVVRNGKAVGNRLCCSRCAEQHATINTAGHR